MYCSLCTQSVQVCNCYPDSIEFTPIVEAFVPALSNLHGTFADWTLADCKWYFENLDWEFVIDGDRNRIFPITRFR